MGRDSPRRRRLLLGRKSRLLIPDHRVRVLIADDDPNVRKALAELVESEASFELVGTAADAVEAIQLASIAQPDVVLVDVRMPRGGGEAAAAGIKRCAPGAKVIALSAQADRVTVLRMLRAGVVGYIVKGGSIDQVVEAIRRAPEGGGTLSIEVAGDVIHELTEQLAVRFRAEERRVRCETRIRHVVRDHACLSMVFQPIVALIGGNVVGAEALARFSCPPRRAPNLWFAEADRLGLGVELELAAVRKAFEDLDEIPDGVFLTVNVSPGTLLNRRFQKIVAGIGGANVVAEITEHSLIRDYEAVTRAVRALRALGMRLAVDDAGAGFASLRHILNLSPDLIKLDLTLIRNIHQDSAKQALAAGLISFAQKSGAAIIAEGIEHPDEAGMLVDLGVEYGQGYLLGRPAPIPLLNQERWLVQSDRVY